MSYEKKEETIARRNNDITKFEELLLAEIPAVLWNTGADTFNDIGLTPDEKLIFYPANAATITRNAVNKDGSVIKWKWQGKQPILNRLTGKNIVFFASGVAEWLLLDWLGLDYIVLPSDSKKAAITEFKDKLKDKAVVILPDNDKNGSFKSVIEKLKITLADSYVFNANFFDDKDFRDYCRRVCEPESLETKDAFIESLFYNIWICAGGSEAKDDPVTEDDLFEKVKAAALSELTGIPEDNIYIFYDPKVKEHGIYDDKLNYYKKEKVLEYIRRIKFRGESLKDANKKAALYLHECPNCEAILDTKLPFGENEDKFNIFEPTDVMAYKANDADRRDIDIDYLKENFPHINILLGNLFNTSERLKYFLNWFSYILNTGEKTRNCIVLTGVQGAGKGLLYEFIIKKAFGEAYCVNLLSHNIKSNFTGMLHNKLFVVAEEMEKKLSYNIIHKLKIYVTDPDIFIENKGVDGFIAKNMFNTMIFSNSATPVKMEPSDRRFSVFRCDTPIRNIIDTGTLVRGIKEECQEFLKMVKSLRYDESQATRLFDSDERDIAKDGSLSVIEWVAEKLKIEQFDEIMNIYPDAKGDIERIAYEIKEYKGYALTSSVYSLFEKILGEWQWKKLKGKLYLYFGKAVQRRLTGEEKGSCYKIIDERILSKTARQGTRQRNAVFIRPVYPSCSVLPFF